VTYDEAIEALRKRCENGDGAPDHSEQPPQWKVPDDCRCESCQIRRAVERELEQFDEERAFLAAAMEYAFHTMPTPQSDVAHGSAALRGCFTCLAFEDAYRALVAKREGK
jgi:hypothetical protein